MTKCNFSKKDLQRLEEKHIKELLADSLYSGVDSVDINILSSVYRLLNELGFSDYVYHMNRLQYLSEYDYSEEEYYNEKFPYDISDTLDYTKEYEAIYKEDTNYYKGINE